MEDDIAFNFLVAECTLRSLHRSNVKFENKSDGTLAITASRLQSYYNALSTIEDFVGSMQETESIADSAAGTIAGRTFATSIFYQFYAQYAVISGILTKLFLIALAATLLATSLVLFDLWAAGCLLMIVSMTMCSTMGSLYWLGVGLNSTTATNVIAGLGVSIEFSVHILRYYSSGSGGTSKASISHKQRVESALIEVGSTTFSGIFVTKVIGVAILGTAHSRAIKVYFFRTFAAVVVLGGLHSLVLMPVLLLLVGR
jgi:Niemann-Pick C1 protein